MKRYKKDGAECLWFDPGEIEDIMDAELAKAKLMPPLDNPVVNLEDKIDDDSTENELPN